VNRLLFLGAIAIALSTSATVLGQGMGGGTGGTGGGFGGGTGGTGGGFGGGGTTFGGGGTTFGGGGTTFSGGGTTFSGGGTTFSGGFGMTGGTGTTSGRTGAGGRSTGGAVQISSTNFLANTFANPMYPGRPGSTNISPAAGGFGQPSFGATTGGTATAARTGTTTGRTGTALGGRANVGTNVGTGAVTNYGSPITFAVDVRFAAPPIQSPQLQADLQGLVTRTSFIKQPEAVRIEVSGTTVILRGRVADDDERRLIEGMVRMEPGVREVRNELTIP
jgi:hypothetical protein